MEWIIVRTTLSFLVVLLCIQSPSGVHLTNDEAKRVVAHGASFQKSHHVQKRQAIINPQEYVPLIKPKSASNSLDTPFLTTIGFFPESHTGGRSHTDKCPRDKVQMQDGTCQYLMTQGNCQQNEEVILDYESGKGVCAERLCSPDRIFMHSTQLCHDPGDTSVCPAGREIFYSSYGFSVCACPDGTIESDDDLDDDVCEEILTPTLACSQNQPNTVRWLRNFNSMPECLPDPCGGTNLNKSLLKDGLPFLPSDMGKCHRWGASDGVCPSQTYLALAFERVKGECAELEEAGYEIFDEESLSFFAQNYQPLINHNGGGGASLSPSNQSDLFNFDFGFDSTRSLDGTHAQNNVIEGHPDVEDRQGQISRPDFHHPFNNLDRTSASGAGFAASRGSSFPNSEVVSVSMQLSKDGHEFKVDNVRQNGPVSRTQLDNQKTRLDSLDPPRPSPDFQFAHGFDGHSGNLNNGNNKNELVPNVFSGNRGNLPQGTSDTLFPPSSNVPHSRRRPSPAFSTNSGFDNQNQGHTPTSFSTHQNPNRQRFSNQHSRFQGHQQQFSSNQFNDQQSQPPNQNFGHQSFKSNQGFQHGFTPSQPGFHPQSFSPNQGFHQQGFPSSQSGFTQQSLPSHQGFNQQRFNPSQLSPQQNFQSQSGFQQNFQPNQGLQQSFQPSNGFQQGFQSHPHSFHRNQGFHQQTPHHSFHHSQNFHQGFQEDNQFNSPEIFDPHAPVSIEAFGPSTHQGSQQTHHGSQGQSHAQASFNSLERFTGESFGMRVGRSLGVNPPIQAILKTHVTILPSGEKIVHKVPHPRRIRSADFDEVESGRTFKRSVESTLTEIPDDENKPLSRKKRRALPYASPSNVFETRLLGCRPGAVRDINAKCRDTILPARVPKRRGVRAAPPALPPRPQCPGNYARDIRRQCVPRTTARRSIIAHNLG